VEQNSQITDFRLARAILHHGLAFGQGSRHHQVFSTGDRDLLEDNMRAVQAFGGSFNVSAIVSDGRSELLQAFNVQIYGARSNGAATGLRDSGTLHSRQERPQNQGGSAHGLDDFVSSLWVHQLATTDGGA